MNRIEIPTQASQFRFSPQVSESRERVVWENGKRTDQVQTDDKGRALHGFAATVELLGQRFPAQVVSPTPLPDAVPLGAVFQGTGNGRLTVANQKDGFDLRIAVTVDGYEYAK